MSIKLSKGQKVNLSKDNGSLTEVLVGLGWEVNKFDGAQDFDLDASAFLLSEDGKCKDDADFVFYNNLKHKSGAIVHTGDNRKGSDTDSDDEQLMVYLDKVPKNISRISFVVTIDDADRKKQNFGMIRNAFIRLVDMKTEKEIMRYDLGEDFSIETAIIVGEIYKKDSNWKFNAIGSGFQGGLAALCDYYGIETE